MAVAYDNTSTRSVTTGDQSWTHSGSASAAGALVIIVEEGGTDYITGVTYGGTTMGEVTGSPMLYAGAETGSIHAFFLNDPPKGSQTVAVDTATGSDQWFAACFTVTSTTGQSEVHDTSVMAGAAAQTTVGATLTITKDSFVAGGMYSGLGAPAFTEVSGTELVVEDDLGNDSGTISRGTSIKSTDFSYTWTQASDDGMALVIALTQKEAVSATAALVSGAGSALAGSVILAPNAVLASAAGSAGEATFVRNVSAAAELASASGSASGASVTFAVNAGLASAAGATSAAGASLAVNADLASAAGAGLEATAEATGGALVWGAWSDTWSNAVVATSANAELASGSGSGLGASVTLQVAAGLASASGEAYAAIGRPAKSVDAGLASAAGAAFEAIGRPAKSVDAGLASGAGAAAAATTTLAASPTAGLAAATGTAHNASTSGSVSVNAGLASASGSAHQAISWIAPSNVGLASAAASASGAIAWVQPNAAVAQGSGSAYPALWSSSSNILGMAGLAEGTLTAIQARPGQEGGFPPQMSASHAAPRPTAAHPVPAETASHAAPRGRAAHLVPVGAASHQTPE